MGQSVGGRGRPGLRNDNSGSQQSWVPRRTIFVLANDVAQVFYVKDMSTKPRKRKDKEANTSYDEPKRHIVLSGKRNIVGAEDKTDMSEDYEKFHEISPFRVKTDPSILLNDDDYPWLWCKKQQKHAKKQRKHAKKM